MYHSAATGHIRVWRLTRPQDGIAWRGFSIAAWVEAPLALLQGVAETRVIVGHVDKQQSIFAGRKAAAAPAHLQPQGEGLRRA